jgi:hypothetical protein
MPGFFSAENAARPRHYFTAVPAAQSISMQLNSLSSKQHDTIETFRFIPSRRPVFSNFLRLCQRSEDFAGNLSPPTIFTPRGPARNQTLMRPSGSTHVEFRKLILVFIDEGL